MFSKFENFMNKYIMPVAQKVDKQRHLSAIKASMVGTTPFMILGSFFAIIPALPNMIGENNVVSQFILENSALLDLPVTLSIGCLSIYVTMMIAYNLGNYYKLYIPGCISLATFAFLFMSVETIDGGISIANFGAKGLFVAMLVGMAAVELYRLCKEKNLTIHMPEGVPDFVSRSFELIPTTIIVGGTFIILRGLSLRFFDALPPQIITQFLSPLVGSMDNPWAVLFLHFCVCLVFFFGIHSSVFSPLTGPIRAVFITENILAYQAGTALPHFYTNGTSSAFFGFTGAGITIGCVIACLLSKSKRYRKIGQVALFPSLFGINEPILFGAPIILNPIMFIPFVFGGAIIGTLPMFMMHYGLVKMPTFDPPYVGVFLEGFLTNGDWMSIVANLIQLVLAVLIYYPFFKIMEKQELKAEIERENSKTSIFTTEEQDLLDDLELDF